MLGSTSGRENEKGKYAEKVKKEYLAVGEIVLKGLVEDFKDREMEKK